jgi:hypothetical protein
MRKLAIAKCIISLLPSLPALAQTPAPVDAPVKMDHVKLALHPYDVNIAAAAFSPDGHYLLTGGPDEFVLLWDLTKGQPIRTFEGHEAQVTYVAFSADSHSALTCSSDNSTIQWDISTGKKLSTTNTPCTPQPSSIPSPNGRFILTLGDEAHLIDAATNKPIAALLNLHAGDWAVIDPEGRYDSSTPDYSPVLVWATETQIFELSQLKSIQKTHFTPNLLAHILKSDKLSDLTGQDTIAIPATLNTSAKHTRDEIFKGIWIDDSTGLEWTKKDNGADLTWLEAIHYCRSLDLANHHDWRLPTIDELEKISDPQSTPVDTHSNSEWHVKGNLQLSGWQRSASRESAAGLSIGFIFNSNGERFTTPIGFNNRVGNGPKVRALCVRTNDDQ